MTDEFIDPEKVLDELALKPDMIAADFGCGSGGFTIPLAKRLEEGLVYALDVQKQPLSFLRARYLSENIKNIKDIHCNLEKEKGSTLQDSFLDLVVIANTLFQVEDKTVIISEAVRVLKEKGRLLIVDWIPEKMQGSQAGKISAQEIKNIAKQTGLKLEKEFKAGEYHYGLIFEKT